MRTFFLVIHIAAGFVGMFGGLVPLFVRKGGAGHRRWGRVFTWAMLAASVSAFPLAAMKHDALQAGIGLLAGYGALLGNRLGRRDGATPFDVPYAVLSGIGFVASIVFVRPDAASGRVAIGFGLLGLLLVVRDLTGRNGSLPRRIVDHILATSLTLVVAWSSFLNTQLLRLTGVDWPIDMRMGLPFAIAIPLLVWWTPKWARRLDEVGVGAWIGGREPTELERLRGFGIVEGISFLLLLFVAVPLKHVGGNPTFVRIMGPIHGALAVLYATSVLLAARPLGWRWPRVLGALGAGVVPFGTFLFDSRLRRESKLTPSK